MPLFSLGITENNYGVTPTIGTAGTTDFTAFYSF
jgi:hypothetical protein